MLTDAQLGVDKMPVTVILEPDAALLGAAVAAQQAVDHSATPTSDL